MANASHKPRTPLARQRILPEVAIGDPARTVDGLRGTVERLLAAGLQQERLTEALLTLARSKVALGGRDPIDLAEVVATSRPGRRAEADERDLRWTEDLRPAVVAGDRALLERLVANLVDNPLAHSLPGGHVELTTRADGAGAVVRVVNSGPPVDPAQVARPVEPFQQLGSPRTGANHGLGLSIVQAIATAHDADPAVRARLEGASRWSSGSPRPPRPPSTGRRPAPARFGPSPGSGRATGAGARPGGPGSGGPPSDLDP